jgi:acyl-CoA reductase-like NAD-dependent aldehyde dehydrogenase
MATTELARQQLLIGGSWTEASASGTYEQTSPYTGEQVGIAAAAGREDARAAVDAAHEAFSEWSRSAPAMRRTILNMAAGLLLERQHEIAAAARSRSASRSTTIGAFPPSSSSTRLSWRPAFSAMIRPTSHQYAANRA